MFSELLDLLRTLDYQVYDTDVQETPSFPYILVWGGASNPHREQNLGSQADGVDDWCGVTVAAGTPAGVRTVHNSVRALLQPDGFPINLGGYQLKIREHQRTQVDRDETITGTNRHPAFCVDIYDVTK